MGCWNKTCALSNLPIFVGEDVYVFVLSESLHHSWNGQCYPSYLYSPILLPFESTYDDYGRGELSGGAAFQPIMEALKENLVERDAGENGLRDIEVKKDKFDEEMFFRASQEGCLEVNTIRGDTVKVKYVMMRKDLFDRVLDGWEVEECSLNDNHELIYNSYKFKDAVDSLDEFFPKLLDIREALMKGKGYDLVTASVTASMWFTHGDNIAEKWLSKGFHDTGLQESEILRGGFF